MNIRLRLKGIVQGVGFRPFVYRLAKKLNLKGHIYNDTDGVVIELTNNSLIEQFKTSLFIELVALMCIFL